MAGPALYLGRQGATGDTTGEHFHFTVRKGGKAIPFSTARTDIGQHLQYRTPGSEQWVNLYTKNQAGGFSPAPYMQAPTGDSAFGMRETHPVHGDRRMHSGEDYPLPPGTQLRFLGQGSVSTHAGRGGAGNVSVLRLPSGYELETYHLSELPQAATTRKSDAADTAGLTPDTQAWAQAYVQNQIESQTQQGKLIDALINVLGEKEKPKSLMEQMKEGLIGNALQQALAPKNFLSQFTGSDPYLQGQQYATSQFFGL
jgi:murein DD-endopeptidase MepM/ murein hydrolase activator NlpD